MATEYGFVYFLGNDLMPGIYKIGFTNNHPQMRVDQLSAATACPMPFDLIACFGTANAREVEQEIHQALADRRVNSSREFFRIKANEILSLCRDYGNNCSDLLLTQPAEAIRDLERYRDEQNWKVAHFLAQDPDNGAEWPDDSDIPF